MSKLTPKQEMFCREYLIDLNAAQAAIRAGYSKKIANRIGSLNMSKYGVQLYIEELKEQRQAAVGVDAMYVLRRLVDIDQLDVKDILNEDGSVKNIHNWPDVWRRSISSVDLMELSSGDIDAIIKKIKWPDKIKNLELLGRHVSVAAFKDRLELSGNVGLAERMKKARERSGK